MNAQTRSHPSINEGRRKRGAELPQTKLTEENVKEIRAIHANTKTGMRVLAARYGVSRAAIQQIIWRETWAWVAE